MRITKRQLRRIIKEEKRKLLRETVTDMADFEAQIEEAADGIAMKFGDDMHSMLEDEPDAILGHSTADEWTQQVEAAQEDALAKVIQAIKGALERVESGLHNGDYLR